MTKRLLQLVLLCIVLLALTGCSIVIVPSYSLQVDNYCAYPMYTVSIYIDGDYQGNVTYSRTFEGISRGSHYLRAVGSDGSYIADYVYFGTDMIWTLCP